jgi:hypothetical protein
MRRGHESKSMENKMLKSRRAIFATSAVLFLLGCAVPADSRQDQQDKPKNQEKRQEQPAKQDQPQANRRQDQQQPQQQHQQARGQQDQPRQQQQQQGQQRDNSAKQQAGATTLHNRTSNPSDNRISNNKTIPQDSKSDPSSNWISNGSKGVSSKTTRRGNSSKPEDSRTSNSVSRTTDRHNNAALRRYASSRLRGRVIVPTAGSLSIATGSNAEATTAIAFPMTVFVATMARITHSASTVSPWRTLAGIAASSTAAIGSA